MIHLGLGDRWKMLIGFGCDGASINIANQGLKDCLHETAPWITFVWCLAHRLEALKHAFKHTFFTEVDEMLMQFFSCTKKS